MQRYAWKHRKPKMSAAAYNTTRNSADVATAAATDRDLRITLSTAIRDPIDASQHYTLLDGVTPAVNLEVQKAKDASSSK